MFLIICEDMEKNIDSVINICKFMNDYYVYIQMYMLEVLMKEYFYKYIMRFLYVRWFLILLIMRKMN